MTQLLTKNDSSAKVQRAVRRHLRLAQRTGDDAALAIAKRIAGPAEALDRALGAAAAARHAADDAFDGWEQDDRRLDRAVRSAHRKCVDWDADHLTAGTVALLFAGATPSQITGASREKEPDLAAQIVARGATLPDGHPAAPVLVDLAALADASRAGHRAWIDAVQKAAAAAAVAETARIAVVRAYRDNHIDIERASGADVADDCFPELRHVPGVTEDDDAAHGRAPGV